MSLEGNSYAILYAIKRFGSIPGKKALQKIMYFANLKTQMYSFQWNKFGPYSEELKYALDDYILEELIDVTPIDLLTIDRRQFNMKLSSRGLDLAQSLTLDDITKASVDFAYEVLREKNPREMELLASTHYIMKYNDRETNADYVYEILSKLKPYAGFTRTEVAGSIQELKNLQLV